MKCRSDILFYNTCCLLIYSDQNDDKHNVLVQNGVNFCHQCKCFIKKDGKCSACDGSLQFHLHFEHFMKSRVC